MNLKSMITQSIRRNLAAKDETLDAILGNTMRTKTKNRESSWMKMPVIRWVKKPVAIAFAAALVMTASIFAVAINLNKTAKLELTAVNQHSSAVVAPGDTVTLTVKTSEQTDFKKGVVGLTMDISYDSSRLTYTNETVTSLLDASFSVSANEAQTGTVTVLLFADNAELPLSGAGNGNLFSLTFTVKSDAAVGECLFTPSEYKLADYKDDDTGFELISVTPTPAAAAVTVANPFNVTASAVNHAGHDADPIYGGAVTGGGQAIAGSHKIITITPDAGWYISSVRVDDVPIALDTLDSPGLTLNKANSYTFSKVQADHSIEATFKKIFYMVPGASIRLVDEAALRFGTEVSAEFLADLEDKVVPYSLGTLILPKTLIAEGAELTRTTPLVKDIPHTLWQDSSFRHAEGYRVMTGVMTGIPSSNYARVLAGRAYINFGDDTVYTSETNLRSLAQVAYLAYNDSSKQPLENYYTQAQITKLEAYSQGYSPAP